MYFRVKRVQTVVRTHQDLRRLQLMRVSHKSVVQGARTRDQLSSASRVFHIAKALQKDLTNNSKSMHGYNNLVALGLPNHGADIGRETLSQRVVERRHEITRLEWMGGVNE